MGKDFGLEYDKFIGLINDNYHFALTRWGDGELKILNKEYINLLTKGNGEFIFDNNNSEHIKYSELLMDAFTYNSDDYYVGIACKCCVGDETFNKMKIQSKQPENNLTWANIFVNSNYKFLDTKLIPILNGKKIVIVYNKNGNTSNLPFNTIKEFKVGTNAWIDDYHLIDEIKQYINNNQIKDTIFLIAAGPLANIMVHQLWVNNNENTYIDIGSVLDKYLSLKLTRGYQLGYNTINKICIW